MTQSDLTMHGSMFVFFKQFIEETFSSSLWLELNKKANTNHSTYQIHNSYPSNIFYSLLQTAANLTNHSENELKEEFGEYLVPKLLSLYKSYINPAWKTFELLENTELVMHKAVRREELQAKPPILNVSKVAVNLLIIDYYSKRRMASLAVGIIKGIAKFYNEQEKVRVILKADPDDERVQIRIEFK